MKQISIYSVEDSTTEFDSAHAIDELVLDKDTGIIWILKEIAVIGDALDYLTKEKLFVPADSVGINELKAYYTDTNALGSVSGTVTVNQLLGCQHTATITAGTTFNITNPQVNVPFFIVPTGEFTINTPTSTGVTFNYRTVDSYVSGKSRLWIMFTSATSADWFYANID